MALELGAEGHVLARLVRVLVGEFGRHGERDLDGVGRQRTDLGDLERVEPRPPTLGCLGSGLGLAADGRGEERLCGG
ncbi:hypothetical protein GCM10009761_19600 [Agromyces terreus]